MSMSRIAGCLSLALAAAVLAGCGGGPERLSQKELFGKVVAAEAKAGSSHVAMSLTTPGGQKVRSRGDMKVGDKPSATALAMTMGSAADSLGSIEVRVVDRTFYMRLGALTGNKFAKIDLTDKSNPLAKTYGKYIENVDPGRQISQYEKAVTSFDNKGDAVTLDGVETVPYKITIDPSKVDRFKGIKDKVKQISFVLYVGPDHLPRRMLTRDADHPGRTAMRTDYSRWGKPVVITAPAASQIQKGGALGAL